MSQWFSDVWSWITNKAIFLLHIVIILAAGVSLVFYYQAYSVFGIALFVILGLGYLFYLVDKYVLTSINIVEELQRGNIAVALTILAVVMLFIGAGLLATGILG